MTLADKIEERIRSIKMQTSHKTYGDAMNRDVLRRIALEAADVATEAFGLIEEDRDKMSDALQKIKSWSEAYPLEVFPEPDLKRAAEVLRATGMTLDSISASAARHVIKEVGKIAGEALE